MLKDVRRILDTLFDLAGDPRLYRVKSPMNYVGGKHGLLSQIIPRMPRDIETFYDAFCGGLNVGANIPSKRLIANDTQREVVGALSWMRESNPKETAAQIDSIVEANKLGRQPRNGITTNDNSNRTTPDIESNIISLFASKEESEPDPPESDDSPPESESEKPTNAFDAAYRDLRARYNNARAMGLENLDGADMRAVLYALVVHGYNSNVRFGPNGYNIPYGDRTFNESTRRNLEEFCARLRSLEAQIVTGDYEETVRECKPGPNDYVYMDPPYLITLAPYNTSWNDADECRLLQFADSLHADGIPFGISNVTRHAGRTNETLIAWSAKYNVVPIEKRYDSASYNLKDGRRDDTTEEILVTNIYK